MNCPNCGAEIENANYCPECGTAAAPSAVKKKKNVVIPIAAALAAGIVVFLAVGFFLNEKSGWLDIGSWGKKEVVDMNLSLSFPDMVHEGTYTGTLFRKLPNGHGTFSSPDGRRTAYTLEGNWTDGVLNGPGKQLYESGESYEGEFANSVWHGHGVYQWGSEGQFFYESDFINDKYAYPAEAQAVALVESILDITSKYDDVWRKTVRNHGDLFPLSGKEAGDMLVESVRFDVSYEQVIKSPKRYQEDFLAFSGRIAQIWEEEYYTCAIISDAAQNTYYVMYTGLVDYIEGDTVDFVATPIANHSYKNTFGNDVLCAAMLASVIYD